MRFAVGTKYIHYADKHNRVRTVVDYHVTTNLAGDVVKRVYVVTYEYFGQTLKVFEPESTVARSKIVKE